MTNSNTQTEKSEFSVNFSNSLAGLANAYNISLLSNSASLVLSKFERGKKDNWDIKIKTLRQMLRFLTFLRKWPPADRVITPETQASYEALTIIEHIPKPTRIGGITILRISSKDFARIHEGYLSKINFTIATISKVIADEIVEHDDIKKTVDFLREISERFMSWGDGINRCISNDD